MNQETHVSDPIDSRAWTGEPATYRADFKRWIFGDHCYQMFFITIALTERSKATDVVS